MSDKRRRKRLGSGDSEGSEDSEGPGVVEGKEEEKEGASSDPERDEGVVSWESSVLSFVYSLPKSHSCYQHIFQIDAGVIHIGEKFLAIF